MSAEIMKHTLIVVLLICIGTASSQRKVSRHVPVGADVKQTVDFDCPEEFGYYPHPTDCTQYYVCVFGGALLESCTGGLMYSHELQTCDWPRNVGCDAAGVSSSSLNGEVQQVQVQHSSGSRGSSSRYSAPAAPVAVTVSSRGQPRQLHHQVQVPRVEDYQISKVRVTSSNLHKSRGSRIPPENYESRSNIKQRQHQQQLYADAESDLPPVEEIESDRQQRVYRGQPSTVGQVQRDRDALRHTNAIPISNVRNTKIGVISFGTHQQQQQQAPHQEQQYRVESSTLAPEQYVPSRPVSITTAGNTGRALYNGSQHYDSNQYDPYYPVYDDDVELYRDVAGISESPKSQQVYRGTSATPQQSIEGITVASRNPPQYIQQDTVQYNVQPQQNLYKQTTVDDYADESEPNPYHHSSGRQPARGDRNDLRIQEPTTTKQAVTTTTTTTTYRPKTSPARTTVRGRGSAHYTNSGSSDDAISVNRGTPPTRSRPTLKPSTAIVSKASEFFDIYKYPASRPAPVYPTPQVDKSAAKCRKDVCLLPDCSCGGKEIPGDLPIDSVPQLVLLTFDDSVNDLNKGLYSDLFEKGRVNPNGCPISATFYVSHEWTDYSQVQNLYSTGHEIASHTVSHSFGEQFSQKKWNREVAGQREILSAYGGVHLEDVRGMRAPFLSVGGNKMFKMLYDSNFTYDSSMPVYENRPPSWPYTLDYKLFHDCMIPPCPTRSYPGVWEVPMVMWQDLNGGRCSMGDACSNPPTSDGVFKMLMKNFDRHYSTNRAPFGLFYHAAWFTQPHHKEGFINFLDTINAMKDVYLVTNWQAIQWVRDPTPLSRLAQFQPFQCDYPYRPKRCNNPKVCNLWHKSGVRYMRTCQPCPEIYPWTGKTGIKSSRIDNDIDD